jgi:PAS domain S-box-containing protein
VGNSAKESGAEACRPCDLTRRDRESVLAEEIAGFGHWRLDVASRKTSWSPGMFRIYGLDFAEEPPLATAMAMLHPDDRAQASADAARAIATGEGYSARTRITRPDGSICITDGRTVCELDADGKVAALFGTRVDVTERVLAEQARIDSETRFRNLAESAVDCVLETDMNGVATFASPSVETTMGYAPSEVVGRPTLDLVHPDDREAIRQSTIAWLKAGGATAPASCVFRIVRKDGGIRWMESRPTPIRDPGTGRFTAMADTLRDITDRRLAETALAESEARYRQLADNVTDISIRSDLTAPGRPIAYVSAAVRRLGWEPDELIGRPQMEFVHPDDRSRLGLTAAALARGEAPPSLAMREFRILRKDGGHVWVESNPSLIRDETGRPVATINALRDITERKAAEAAMAESEARFRQLAEQATDITVRVDLSDTITYVSPAVRRYGYEPQDIVGRQRDDFVQPDHQAALKDAYAEMRSGGDLTAPELRAFRVHARDGREVWMEGSPSLARDASGAVTGVVTVLRDITDRRAAETALAESEARYRLVTEASRDLVLKHNAYGLIEYASSSARHFGYRPGDLVGRYCGEFIHPEDLDRVNAFTLAIIRGAAQSETVCHYRLAAADGTWIWVEGNPAAVRDENGHFLAVINGLRDITERKALEAKLATSEARLRGVMEAAPDVIAESDLGGRILYLSPAFKAITGFDPETRIGKRSFDLLPPREGRELEELCLEIALSGGRAPTRSLQYGSRHADGREIWLECRPAPKFDHLTGQVVGFIDVIRDVTSRKAMEDDLERARAAAEEAAAVKGEFLANMSHELRTPLTSVLGFTRLALERPGLDGIARDYIRKASGAGAALLTTVNDILDFSTLEAGQVEIRPRPIRVRELCAETLELFSPRAAEKGLTLALDARRLPALLAVDPDRLRQLLLNLVGNAVKFSDEGEIRVVVGWKRASQRLSVKVIDQGQGLTGDQQARLFQRFSQVDGSSTRKHGGTGLGLAICRGLVEAMQGTIGVDSTPGQGACFFFEITAPRCEATARPRSVETIRALPAFPRGARVLVADDHPVNRELVRAILTPLGAQVTEAADGLEAVEAAGAAPFDIILMDLRMPGLDGLGAMRAIRAAGGLNANVPILAFSAGADPASEAGRMAAGFDGDLHKPIVPGQLTGAIVQQLCPAAPAVAEPQPLAARVRA